MTNRSTTRMKRNGFQAAVDDITLDNLFKLGLHLMGAAALGAGGGGRGEAGGGAGAAGVCAGAGGGGAPAGGGRPGWRRERAQGQVPGLPARLGRLPDEFQARPALHNAQSRAGADLSGLAALCWRFFAP